jgi:UDP-glucose 4-epimerase
MKILITGALGHIGSRLIRALPQKIPDTDLVLLDNLATQRYCSLFELPKEVEYKFIIKDVVEDDLSSVIRNVDVVIHLAAFTEASSSINNAGEVERVNFEGLKKVADTVLDQRKKLIFLSTTNMYAGLDVDITDSNFNEYVTPANPYAKSKRDAELYLESLVGLEYTVLRFGTIAGFSPGMRFHTAVNKFIWQAQLGLPISVWRTALNQKRPYLDIIDACEAISSVVKLNLYNREIYNVVTESCAVADILDVIGKFYPSIKVELVEDKAMNDSSFSVRTSDLLMQNGNFKGSIERAVEEMHSKFFRS